MDHPMTEKIQRTGYPHKETYSFRTDTLGNTIYKGDELLEMNDQVFVVDTLSPDTKKALRAVGAEYTEA